MCGGSPKVPKPEPVKEVPEPAPFKQADDDKVLDDTDRKRKKRLGTMSALQIQKTKTGVNT